MFPSPGGEISVHLRLIGEMEAWTTSAESVLPPGRKTRALLAGLALASPRAVSRTRLSELFFRGRPGDQARMALRQEIQWLAAALEPANTEILRVTRTEVSLDPDKIWLDVRRIMEARPDDPTALSLFDAELLADLDGIDPAFDRWLSAEREKLRDRARGLAETLLAAQTEFAASIVAARRLLQIDATHEGAWRALIRAYAAHGDQATAVQAFERCRTALAQRLGVGPSRATRELLMTLAATARSPRRADTDVASPQPPIERNGPLVAVLPPRMIGPGGGASGPAIAETIGRELARFQSLSVLPWKLLSGLAQERRPEARIRQSFGVDYLIDGTIQPAGSNMRFNARLMDLRAGNQVIWAGRFDLPASALALLDAEALAPIVAQSEAALGAVELARSASQPEETLSPYQLTMRALPVTQWSERNRFDEAGRLLRAAMARDPELSAPRCWSALWHVVLYAQGWSPDRAEVAAIAWQLANEAVERDPLAARPLTIGGHVAAFLRHDFDTAVSFHRRALTLNPNLAIAWAFSALTQSYLGNLDEAERRNNRYKALSPMNALGFMFDTSAATIALLKHDHRAAAAIGRIITQTSPSYAMGYKPLLAALGHLGQARDAGPLLRRLLTLEPGFTTGRFIESYPLVRLADREHFAAGLRLAGAP